MTSLKLLRKPPNHIDHLIGTLYDALVREDRQAMSQLLFQSFRSDAKPPLVVVSCRESAGG